MKAERVSRSEYAARRGVSRQAVAKAIQTGRIAGAVGPDGRIDPVKADRLWSEGTQPLRGGRREKAPGAGSQREQRAAAARLEAETAALEQQLVDRGAPAASQHAPIPSLNVSRTRLEYLKAQLAQLDYDERTARLVPVDDVASEWFRVARLTRDAMLGIPDRVASELAGMVDAFEIHAKLTGEVRAAIESLCRDEVVPIGKGKLHKPEQARTIAPRGEERGEGKRASRAKR